jgi:hypothetical protein
MNELELKKLWQTTNDKLEGSIVVNKNNTEDITRVKVHSILGSMKPIKIFTLLVGILWVGIGVIALSSIYLNSFSEANKFFLFSASMLWVTRILFLQLPVWTTFWWNETMLSGWGILQWVVTLFFTISFTAVAIWLFFNIKYVNRNKKWFQLIFSGKEWAPLMKSMELLEQVEDYKEQNAST